VLEILTTMLDTRRLVFVKHQRDRLFDHLGPENVVLQDSEDLRVDQFNPTDQAIPADRVAAFPMRCATVEVGPLLAVRT
jgi:hypothetical protein